MQSNTLKHLIIGWGNIGQKHKSTLESIGDETISVDIDFKPHDFSFNGIDSVLICTPPETHSTYVRWFAEHRPIPLFCEKPPFTQPMNLTYPGISLAACNWRYCPHIKPFMHRPTTTIISCEYPTTKNNAFLDLIHFIDLFWSEMGRPNKLTIKHLEQKLIAHIERGDFSFYIELAYTTNKIEMHINNQLIHLKPCSMFKQQFLDWKEIISGKKSPNPIEMATERMNWLLCFKPWP